MVSTRGATLLLAFLMILADQYVCAGLFLLLAFLMILADQYVCAGLFLLLALFVDDTDLPGPRRYATN